MVLPNFVDGQVLTAADVNLIADEVDRLGTAKAETIHGHALTDANMTGVVPIAQVPTITVAKGGTGRTTSTTAYGLIAAGTTATGNQQTVAPGTSGHALVSGGAAALPAFRQLTYADVTGTVPTAALPPLAINETFVVASQAAMLALVAQRGDMAIRTDNARTYVLATDAPTVLADWKEISAAGQVTSVAGKTGAVSLVKADVGLGSVDNTADSAKPVSTAQASAIALKANIASPTFTGTVGGITKAMVGLGSVDNTTDAAKPVSTAQQTALNLKANLASPTFTGSVTVPTPTTATQAATKGYVDTAVAGGGGGGGGMPPVVTAAVIPSATIDSADQLIRQGNVAQMPSLYGTTTGSDLICTVPAEFFPIGTTGGAYDRIMFRVTLYPTVGDPYDAYAFLYENGELSLGRDDSTLIEDFYLDGSMYFCVGS